MFYMLFYKVLNSFLMIIGYLSKELNSLFFLNKFLQNDIFEKKCRE